MPWSRPRLTLRPLRSSAHCWLIYGKVGTPSIPHVFMAGRSTWVFDRGQMRFTEAELGMIQSLPGGRLESYLEMLAAFKKKAAERFPAPAKLLVLADLTRSLELCPAIWRVVPEALPVIITNAPKDDWSLPFRLCGRPLLLSRLQLWVAEKKIAMALPLNEQNDPNIWNQARFQADLGAVGARPPKADGLDMLEKEALVQEDAVLAVAMLPWWADSEVPDIYEDEGQHAPHPVIQPRNVS